MKTKINLFLALFCLAFAVSAQQNEECMEKLSIFTEAAKVKNYDAAMEPWMFVRKTCPKLNNAIYVYGEKILKNKIKKSTGADKTAAIKDLMSLYKESMANMPKKFPVGKTKAKMGQLMFDEGFGTPIEQFNVFDEAYEKDAKTFQNPKSLYTYFKLAVGLYDNKTKDFQYLIDMYTKVTDKVEDERKNFSSKKDALLVKEEAGTITKKETRKLNSYSSFVSAYDQISGGIDKEIGTRAECDNLVPLFEKNYEANKTNSTWLRNAASRLAGKDCSDAPIFAKLVASFHELEPSAKSALYLGILNQKKGKTADADKYYNEAADLSTDNYDKAKIYYSRLAVMYSKKGAKGKARAYANKALAKSPSMGRAYTLIAKMYASSANSCGSTTFEKRAVYWLAANTADKAGRVDASLKSYASKLAANYRAKAPSKQDIFTNSKYKPGDKVTFGCWIGSSVTVPSL
ncbi:tetratricopeptide repeat protein [Pseudofulvibacter geojedonensis]|uniref:Tetratricopeptide repeat protein n=1 Tax=Pseudofulvibacter geojedonensis TaxID=1123758 RepID=A0ABW3I3K3_9FLAO